MKLMFGVVSLLVVLAIVAVTARQQMRASADSVSRVSPAASPGAAGNVAEESRRAQQRVADDVNKALQSGMQRNEQSERREDGEK